MCPNPVSGIRPSSCRRQRGLSLISAIFLLVVMASLGAAMLRFSNVRHLGSARELDEATVTQLAKAGLDYGVYRVLQANSCAGTNLPFGIDYAATVNCASDGPFPEPGGSVMVYRIVSTACNRPAAGACPGTADGLTYVERRLSLTLAR